MNCPDCGATMKPLATSVFCPNDCDRKTPVARSRRTGEMVYVHDRDGSRWAVEWVERDGWPTTEGHRGWHYNGPRPAPQYILDVLTYARDTDRTFHPGQGDRWETGPGLPGGFAYQGRQLHTGFVFRKLS